MITTTKNIPVEIEGFLLTGDCEDVKGRFYLRFVGISSCGPFEVILTQEKPRFFIQASSGEEPTSVPPGAIACTTNLKTFDGQQVDQVTFMSLHKARSAKEWFKKRGTTTYESDIKPVEKFLMDAQIFGHVKITDPKYIRSRPGLIQWIDPKIEALPSRQESPQLTMLSLDIETGKQGQLFSIAFHGTSREGMELSRDVFICKKPGTVEPVTGINIFEYDSEQELLQAMITYILKKDPDLIIGWNVISFDLDFILKKMKLYNIPPRLGRNQGILKIFRRGTSLSASVHGRIVIDVPRALRMNFFQFERFSLDFVAQTLLGEAKLISTQKGKWDEIERQYYEEPESLIRYNFQDAQLVTKIVEKTRIIELLKARSIISGMLLSRVGASTSAFDHQMIPAIHEAGYVVPELEDVPYQQSAKGGHVFPPNAGIHQDVIVLDFKSLYPSIIKTFHIDPLAILKRDLDPLDTPVGIRFSKNHHALPRIIDKLLLARKHAKESGDTHLSQAIKILMNSFYGVMGSAGCRFYHQDLPTAITGIGRKVLEASKDYLEGQGYQVIYGDTDSVFVTLNDDEKEDFEHAGKRIARSLNQFFCKEIFKKYGVESHLEMEYEKYYSKFFLPPMRGNQASANKGSKKRYAGLIRTHPSQDILDDQLSFTGMEFVRSDWTQLAKTFQWTLYQKLFLGEPIKEWIQDFVQKLTTGKLDGDLIYQKRLTKPAREYTKSKPPHVKAALVLLNKDPMTNVRSVRYLMTEEGPIPEEFEPRNIDYQHYVDKQLKPIADTILPYFGTSFNEINQGATRQPSLF